jgi:hypothetical protein
MKNEKHFFLVLLTLLVSCSASGPELIGNKSRQKNWLHLFSPFIQIEILNIFKNINYQKIFGNKYNHETFASHAQVN